MISFFKKNKSQIRIFIASVLLCAILWQVGDVGQIGIVLKRLNPFLAFIVLIAMTFDRGLMAFKWGYLLRAQGEKLPFIKGLQIYCASAMWGLLLPTTLGTDAVRAYITTKTGINGNHVISSIIVERMVGFVSSLIWGIIGVNILFLTLELNKIYIAVGLSLIILLFISVLGFLISFNSKIYEILFEEKLKNFTRFKLFALFKKFHEAYLVYGLEKERLVIFFKLTLVEHLISFITGWLIAISFDINVSIIFMIGIIPLGSLVARLPISISGIGVLEGFFIFAMSMVGVTAAEGVTIALGARIFQIITITPWWLSYMLETNEFRPKVPQQLKIKD